MYQKLKQIAKKCLHLIFPKICLHCSDPLEESSHFCVDCLSRIQISRNSAAFVSFPEGAKQMVQLLENSDVSTFIQLGLKRFDLSFLTDVIAPLYYYKATSLGWQNFQVMSDDMRLKNAFQKLQTRVDKGNKLWVSIKNRKELSATKIPKKASRILYLIDTNSL